MSALRIAGVVAGALVVAVAAAIAAGTMAWRRDTARHTELLDERARARGGASLPPFRRTDLAGLPAPVARYLAFALPDGQPRARVARIRWTGEMRLQPDGAWSRFIADQAFTTSPPGFVWDARFRMIPLVPVLVRDSYVGAEGRMLGRIGGVMNVVNEGGTPGMAQSALARWLGEAAWFPTAFLPGADVTWEGVDDRTARATVVDGAVRVTADFHFAATGELTSMSALRYRDVNGTSVLTPFEGRYGRFERRAGVMIPGTAEVAWLLPGGRFVYWRGQPTEVSATVTPARGAGGPE